MGGQHKAEERGQGRIARATQHTDGVTGGGEGGEKEEKEEEKEEEPLTASRP